MNEKFLEAVASFITKTPTEFLGTLKTESGEWLEESEVIKLTTNALSKRMKDIRQSGKDEGLRTKGEEIEKFVKSKFDFTSDKKGTEFIEAFIAHRDEANKPEPKTIEKPIELTEETAKENPIVQNLIKDAVRNKTQELQKSLNEKDNEFKQYKADQYKEKVTGTVKSKAVNVLDKIKAVLEVEGEEGSRDKRIGFFLNALNYNNFKLDDKGEPIPINPETGEQLEDPSNFQPVSFEDYIRSQNPYGVHRVDPQKSSASPSSGNNRKPSTPNGIPNFNSREEMYEYVNALPPNKRQEKIEILEAWTEKEGAEA